MKRIALIAALALAACSPSADEEAEQAAGSPAPSATPVTIVDGADPNTLRLEGLAELRIGQPLRANGSFAAIGAQIPGSDCRTVSSPAYPGVYAMTIAGEVRRITVGGNSPVTLVEGIGAGASEQEVSDAFPGFRESPHKYGEAPAKYLAQPGDDPRLRFEIGADRKVALIHVGLMPQLGYVEGCA